MVKTGCDGSHIEHCPCAMMEISCLELLNEQVYTFLVAAIASLTCLLH